MESRHHNFRRTIDHHFDDRLDRYFNHRLFDGDFNRRCLFDGFGLLDDRLVTHHALTDDDRPRGATHHAKRAAQSSPLEEIDYTHKKSHPDSRHRLCRKPVVTALQDAGLKPNQIDEVVLVVGMTRMQRVQQLVKEVFGKEGHKGVNPDEVVAIGAAIQGAQLLLGSKSELLLLDVTPLSLGIETLGGIMDTIIPKNTTIPKRE